MKIGDLSKRTGTGLGPLKDCPPEPRDKGDELDGEGIGICFIGADRGSFGGTPACEGGEELKGLSLKIGDLNKGKEAGIGPLEDCSSQEPPSCAGGLGNGSGADGGVKLVALDGLDIVRNEGRPPPETWAALDVEETL